HEETTLAEHLKEAGYATAHIGKWHLGEDSTFWPQYQGFDLNVGGYNKGQPPSYFAPYERKNWQHIPHLKPGPAGEYLTYRLAEEASQFIQDQQSNTNPFFLYMAHYTVHTPLQAPDSLKEYYTSKITPGHRHKEPTYAAMVHSLDQSIGRVRAALESTGQWDNTLIIFASDNGGLDPPTDWTVTDNYPLREGKGTAYEGGVRTPMIIRYPRAQGAGQTSAQPVITMDLFATALEAAGLNPKLALDGVSLWNMQENASVWAGDRILYWHYPHYHTQGATPYSAIRMGDYRLLEFYEDGHRELYNLATDLGETTDLINSHPKIAKKLTRKLQRWRKKVDAQDPVVNPDAKP
ncbi:MAG: sulfatase, partial [Bacteroidota bacterium]